VDVSILIISFNTRELTLACFRSVYEQTAGVEFEVVVVDNASTDGSAEAIRAAYPQVKLIALETNIGFAGGNNLAARQANGEFLLLLNPDTVILDGAVQKAVGFAREHAEVGIVGGRTFSADMRLDRNSCHGRPTPWSLFCMGMGLSSLMRKSALFNPESLGNWQRDSSREVDAVTGCFLLIRRGLWDRLGGFDESFFMYGEDTDLCIRAWEAGSRCRICPEAKLIHYGGKSEKVRSDKMVKLFAAKAQLIRKHWKPGTAWFGIVMLELWALSRMAVLEAAGLVGGSGQNSGAQWREVWRRRREFAAKSSHCRTLSSGQRL
jgi:hypothetical protein